MPSLKCYQCGKVKRCQMVVTRNPDDTRPQTEYLCRPCARELGYAPTK